MIDPLQILGANPDAVLGNWAMSIENIPEGSCLVRIPRTLAMATGGGVGLEVPADNAPVISHGRGDRVHVTIEFDVLLDDGSAPFVNRMCQEAFDGVRIGALEITSGQLVLIDEPVKPDVTR
jgi:hypothetical protein